MQQSESWNSSVTTDSSTGGAEELYVHSHPLYTISRHLWNFGSPVLLLLGNFGNAMTLVIMRRMRSGEAVINIYFTALALVDLVTLDVFLLGQWAGVTFGYHVKLQSNAACKVYNWVITTCTTIGGWFLVGLTSHRAVSVVWPHRVNVLCTRRLVVSLMVGMAAVFAAVYSHYLYGYNLHYVSDTGEYQCKMLAGRYLTFVEKVFTYVDLLLYSLLPFLCILLANSVLVCKLRGAVEDVRRTFAAAQRGIAEQVAAREKAASSVSVTVVLVSVAYVVLTMPASVYYVSLFVFDPSADISPGQLAVSSMVRAVTYLMMFSNSAVNFYLYCLSGERFRKEFVKIFRPSAYSTTTASST